MHNQAVLSAAAASTICFRDTNSSHQFIWASILNIHPCMSHERQHRRQTSNRMVRYAVLYMQQYHNNRCLGKSSILPSAKQSLRCSPPPDQHTPCDPQMSSNRKNAFMSRYATHQQRQRHHNLQLASVAATVLSTNTMMRWRSTTQLAVPLQYHHHQRVPKAAQCSKHHLPKHASRAMCRCQ